MRAISIGFVVTLLLLLGGCAATGPLHKDISAKIPPIPQGQGRVYFVRESGFVGGGLRPDINLNGRVVGQSAPGSFFFVDENPGKCLVSTATEVEKQLTFTLAAGETKYVRTTVSMGILVGRVNPELMSADEAKALLPDLHYTGAAIK